MNKLIGVLTMIAACTAVDDEQGVLDATGDGKSDSAAISDGSFDARAILKLVNTGTFEELEASGVRAKALTNIWESRIGDDEVEGTDDDVVFESVVQLDWIPAVGPAEFTALRDAARARYITPTRPCGNPNNSSSVPSPLGLQGARFPSAVAPDDTFYFVRASAAFGKPPGSPEWGDEDPPDRLFARAPSGLIRELPLPPELGRIHGLAADALGVHVIAKDGNAFGTTLLHASNGAGTWRVSKIFDRESLCPDTSRCDQTEFTIDDHGSDKFSFRLDTRGYAHLATIIEQRHLSEKTWTVVYATNRSGEWEHATPFGLQQRTRDTTPMSTAVCLDRNDAPVVLESSSPDRRGEGGGLWAGYRADGTQWKLKRIAEASSTILCSQESGDFTIARGNFGAELWKWNTQTRTATLVDAFGPSIFSNTQLMNSFLGTGITTIASDKMKFHTTTGSTWTLFSVPPKLNFYTVAVGNGGRLTWWAGGDVVTTECETDEAIPDLPPLEHLDATFTLATNELKVRSIRMTAGRYVVSQVEANDTNGSTSVDVLMRFGAPPTATTFDTKITTSSFDSPRMQFIAPRDGTLYIGVRELGRSPTTVRLLTAEDPRKLPLVRSRR